MLTCSTCRKIVDETDCTFGGLHAENDCHGRVFFDNGREYFGSMKQVSRTERAGDARLQNKQV